MSTYKDCRNLVNNLANFKMDTRDDTFNDDVSKISPSNASPPDFDFSLPCRFFKSSFARSLSLNSGNNSNLCKSLDYDMRSNNSNNNKLSCLKRDTTAVKAVPTQTQRFVSQAVLFYQQNEANSAEEQQVFTTAAAITTNNSDGNRDEEKAPALPTRCPPSLHAQNTEQKLPQQQQTALAQLRQQAYKQAVNNSNNNAIMPVNVNNNNKHATVVAQMPQQNAKPHHFSTASNCNNSSINNNNKNNSNSNNIRRNNNNNNQHIVWSNENQKNVEQNCNICTFKPVKEDIDNGGEDFNSNYHGTIKSSAANSDYNNHFHNSHQIMHNTIISAINIHNNQQPQQQQQNQQQMPSYEMLNDNNTNVEAIILQNQVDTLQWQLKQVETSCDMYRAVMEEVARFLERYQSQKQLQQEQQQQQLQQMQQQKAALQKQSNSKTSNKLEQIQRSKSLFQVNTIAGGHEKSTNGGSSNNKNLNETSTALTSASSTSTSYLRARSSTNLIDLKHQQSNDRCNSHRKDDHNFETGLTPSQSYSAFKDFTWRRPPKQADSHLITTKDDVEVKLNQEVFRLLRTINNLLNTSQHQPDLTHYHRHSLAPTAKLPFGRLTKAMCTTSEMTLPPEPPMLNSTNLALGANIAGSSTADSSTASSTICTGNNVATNNLAPEMIFMRSANMRDSRLSLRSSTDSSVHSTSSAASSASSKVETDEEPSTPFHSPPNALKHKQQQHLAGSSTEDESGFSSISSFPDIGVPLSSTMLSSTPKSSKGRLVAKELNSLKASEKDLQTTDSRNSTLKANVVGLPLNSSQDMSHRWDSPSKTYHNASNKFQRFSALNNEDSNTVLWV